MNVCEKPSLGFRREALLFFTIPTLRNIGNVLPISLRRFKRRSIMALVMESRIFVAGHYFKGAELGF